MPIAICKLQYATYRACITKIVQYSHRIGVVQKLVNCTEVTVDNFQVFIN